MTFGEKPWYKSVTAIGAIVYAGVQGAEQVGVLAPGTGTAVLTLVSQLAVVFGLRRAIG